MKQAIGAIRSMNRRLNRLTLDGEFDLNLDDYLPDTDILDQSAMLQTPDINPGVLQSNLQSSVINQQGLTPSEQALLSEEEKAIRLRQRGLA